MPIATQAETVVVGDVTSWITAWHAVSCGQISERPCPTIQWRVANRPVQRIQVCEAVTVRGVIAAAASGANLIVARVSLFDPESPCATLRGMARLASWAATFSRHGISCLAAPTLFQDPHDESSQIYRAGTYRCAERLIGAFPEVSVSIFGEDPPEDLASYR